ncbi:excise [Mycobacterium phage BIB8]|uniref:HTH protein n=2 Tax=Brujitavirus TaxID=2169611 RepID=E0YQ35_9CAUD|nr:excisionase and transcriptional regulator [Mycobacterium phage Xula]ADL71217.1 HTH protein [Mycobacterium phage Island3]QFG15039.1 helix-turn-helix DNA binding domain protein [Mycobacterium phage QueenHazel]WAW19118.1 excise [Mycobacterium phage BIB10]WAW19180.1 excise [Mycobacterium phage BIB9]WAW19242.1 excise [Mycobacterium phage BIB8]WAW19304.1 excise [Mycobacterium phage BIB7]WAW19366.1 excise [Mycobacterium phage BIB6]WAW19428.1 excise [Mycobacterium phage BIB4]WAW19490.1 excise [
MSQVVLLTTTEVAKRFGVDTSAVRRWVASGKLKPTVTTPGGHYRFDERTVAGFQR